MQEGPRGTSAPNRPQRAAAAAPAGGQRLPTPPSVHIDDLRAEPDPDGRFSPDRDTLGRRLRSSMGSARHRRSQGSVGSAGAPDATPRASTFRPVAERTPSQYEDELRTHDPGFSILDLLSSPFPSGVTSPESTFGENAQEQEELEPYNLTADHVKAAFERYDGDNDGRVTKADLRKLFLEYGFYASEEALLKLQEHFDTDADGKLCVQDVMCLLKELVLADLFMHGGACRVPMGVLDYGVRHKRASVIVDGAEDADEAQPSPASQPGQQMGSALQHGRGLQRRRIRPLSEQQPSRLKVMPPKQFFFGHRWHSHDIDSPKLPMRWIHVDTTLTPGTESQQRSQNTAMLLRLMAKYGLHPLAVEDALDDATATKVDSLYGHYFLSMELVSLASTPPTAEQDDVSEQQYRATEPSCWRRLLMRCFSCWSAGSFSSHDRWAPPEVALCRSRVSLFVAGLPHRDTVISVHSHAGATRALFSRMAYAGTDTADYRGRFPCIRSDGGPPLGPGVMPWRGIFHDLRLEVEREPHRRVREHGSDFLMYRIVDRVVDELLPVTNAYAMRLAYFNDQMKIYGSHFHSRWLEELNEAKLELTDLARIVRPLRSLVRQFIEGGRSERFVTNDTRTYFVDVVDHIEQLSGDIDVMLRLCEGIQERFLRHTDKNNNSLSFVFTITATVFLPGQFLASVYGMNFVDDLHMPTIPELRWASGYTYFWGLAVGMSLLTTSVALLMWQPPRCCRERAVRKQAERRKRRQRSEAPWPSSPPELSAVRTSRNGGDFRDVSPGIDRPSTFGELVRERLVNSTPPAMPYHRHIGGAVHRQSGLTTPQDAAIQRTSTRSSGLRSYSGRLKEALPLLQQETDH
eukprot:TRINITY_DN932_c0_g1_i1.p1 TRINITY_DN932_c0_g1~~TRINITY_DN932_c0_g1_i1.p1  ORF type:complete len:884 (+),score=161.45 TRINITY_DN932_c0_g1_i1:77-2653(+)